MKNLQDGLTKQMANITIGHRMKTLMIILVSAFLGSLVYANDFLPAFPGAEGFGARTGGGRGGKVFFVTNLYDDGPGSLRHAIGIKGPRIIIFRTGGTIRLKSHLRINEPYLTIAGQSAPGGGILLRDAGMYVSTHDVVIRHLRIRIGASRVEEYDTQDCLHVGDGDGVYNIMIDHCSFSWSIDEVASVVSRAHDVTLQWCIIAEALREPLKLDKQRHHAYCLMLGNYPNHVSIHHNLLAHCEHRNPRIQGGTHDFVNNVVYNWGYFTAVFSRDPNVNFVGNFYKPGPESRLCLPLEEKPDDMGRVYVRGNRCLQRPTDNLPEWEQTVGVSAEKHRAPKPFLVVPVKTTTAEEAYRQVLNSAGARLPMLDAVDHRILKDVRNGTGRVIDLPEEVGGFSQISKGMSPRDSDHDGMPDAWEIKYSLDPNDPSDNIGDRDGDGYTNVEEYLNKLTESHINPNVNR